VTQSDATNNNVTRGDTMTIGWFRSWHGAPTDYKYGIIAKMAKVPVGMVISTMWALLDAGSQCKDRGSLNDFDARLFAAFADYEYDHVCAVLEAMNGIKLIVDGRLANWDKRQPGREDRSADRMRALRERRENAPQPKEEPKQIAASKPDVADDVPMPTSVTFTDSIDLGDGPVTQRDAHVTQRDAVVTLGDAPRRSVTTDKKRVEKKEERRKKERKKKQRSAAKIPIVALEPLPPERVLTLAEVGARARKQEFDRGYQLPEEWLTLAKDLVSAFEDIGVPAVSTNCLHKWKEFGWVPSVCKATIQESLDRGSKPRSLLWFEKRLEEIHDKMRFEQAKPVIAQMQANQDWEARILRYRRNPGLWVIAYGPPPGAPNCRAPPELLKRLGFEVTTIGQAQEPVSKTA
jgi:hypothetical protein